MKLLLLKFIIINNKITFVGFSIHKREFEFHPDNRKTLICVEFLIHKRNFISSLKRMKMKMRMTKKTSTRKRKANSSLPAAIKEWIERKDVSIISMTNWPIKRCTISMVIVQCQHNLNDNLAKLEIILKSS